MSKKQFIKRHHLIINKLRANPCSFKDLLKHLETHSDYDDEKYEISKRTFERDVAEIRSIYNIEIEYNRSRNVYQIVSDADEMKTDRLIESFEIFNALSISDTVSRQILIEKRKPLGTENIFGLLHAIKNRSKVKFSYTNYLSANKNNETRLVYPLALKEAKNRWYLVAQDSKDKVFKAFGLERMLDLEITKEKFEFTEKFDLEEEFKYSFGIYFSKKEPKIIKLRFSTWQASYIKSLPLHHSQKIVSENETECIIELQLDPTYDFVMELLSMGKEVQVLEPEDLRKKIKSSLQEAIKFYE